ncbi:MAG: hypothetical protein D6E12_05895 [Desulfovibrio sp.]|nr:MAG: hypothetical protein D6E12_05895 [Desulfovibrio sp.]
MPPIPLYIEKTVLKKITNKLRGSEPKPESLDTPEDITPSVTTYNGVTMVEPQEFGDDTVASFKEAMAHTGSPARPKVSGNDGATGSRDKVKLNLEKFSLNTESIESLVEDGITHVLYHGQHEAKEDSVVLRYSTEDDSKECYVCVKCKKLLNWLYVIQPNQSHFQVFTCKACGHKEKTPLFLSETQTWGFTGVFSPKGEALGRSLVDVNETAANWNELHYMNQQLSLKNDS